MSRLATILLLPVLAAACAIIPPKLEGISQRNMEDAVLSMATAALRTGQVETARRLYRRLLEVDPESVAARMGLGNVSLRRQDPALAARWYLLALARAVEPAERHAALLAHGRAALSAGQVDAARDSFVRLTDPREGAPPTYVAWGYNGLGLAHILSGDAWGAVAAIERAVLTAPEEPRFQGNLDRALAMLPAAGAEQLRSGEPTGKPLPEADAGASNPAAIRPEAPAAVSAPVAATDPAGGQPRPVADADRAPQVPAPPEQAAPDPLPPAPADPAAPDPPPPEQAEPAVLDPAPLDHGEASP
ncbi:MAG: tetratricopeptide repeat protein, partial [Acidobacteria bacterium]|nr:tetratricopeptide repeat protein [Acidobacteriota bacterium]